MHVHSRPDNTLKGIMIFKVHGHFLPRKQGNRLVGIDFVHFGLESLCLSLFFIVSIPNEKEIEIIMRIIFHCCSKLI